MNPTTIVYSDEASMANGSNGESTLPMVTPQIVEELETGLVPQAQAQPVAGLLVTNVIFVNAPQYHWHVQGAMGADDEARQHIVALAQRLHQFGHRTEEREMELWHRLSNVADFAWGGTPIGQEPKKSGKPSITSLLPNCPVL